ncbi:MAG: hypothetical protein CFH44_00414 [Proteobacteria bacterium]|nr:MAG: hypothetical protein CFH44_00414 [Pseudomonadota bacterium]
MRVFTFLLCSLVLLTNSVFAAEAPGAGAGSGGAGSVPSGVEEVNDMYSMYDEFEMENSMNFSDCHDFGISFGIAMCPGFLPFPTLVLKYKYWDPIAMVEVVHDPWRSFLYKESLYDFSGNSETAAVDAVGLSPTIGSGFNNRKATSSGKDFIGTQKMETHVWAVSDWWRLLKTSSYLDSCTSLTCKNKDWSGCIFTVINSVVSISSQINETISSINKGEGAEGKGQGVKNGDSVHYEDGSVYEKQEVTNSEGDVVGEEYVETREPGNYGVEGSDGDFIGQAAEVAMSDSIIPGMTNAEMLSAGFSLATGDPVGAGLAVGGAVAGDLYEGSALQESVNTGVEDFKTNVMGYDPEAEAPDLPASTKTGGVAKTEGSGLAGTTSSNSTGASQAMSNNAMGRDDPSQKGAEQDIMSNIPGAASGFGTKQLDMATSVIDRIVYFNVVEQLIQMVATVVPIMVHPVYMSERHEKASSDGGIFWSSLFQSFADMGAGMIMPVFCMGRTMGMAVDGVANLVGVDISSSILGPFSNFLVNRCAGSWGPLEPRVTLMGTGDHMVAAGIASVRGLNIAQSITGDMYNKTINNTPFTQLRFNLDWPHQSGCYGFTGFDGMSRGWTSPALGIADQVVNAVKTGDLSGFDTSNTDVNPVNNAGGYVFTYWKNRKCEYWISCNKWKGDTGL